MYKIIATDLDETLLNDKKHVSKDDIDTISKLTDCKLVIATGRGFEAVQANLKEINQFNQESQYLISFNGGVITENKNNRILYSNLMEFDDVQEIFNFGLKYDICIDIYTLECCYCYRLFEKEKDWLIDGNFHIEEFNTTDLSFLKDKKIAKMLFCKVDIPYLKQIKKEINLDDRFSISFSSDRYLEINPKGVNKGLGLQKLCEILNIDIKDTIGVGDNINDIELIQSAGIGIGVKNTIPEVVPYCDEIIDVDNNHNPISYIVDKYEIK